MREARISLSYRKKRIEWEQIKKKVMSLAQQRVKTVSPDSGKKRYVNHLPGGTKPYPYANRETG